MKKLSLFLIILFSIQAFGADISGPKKVLVGVRYFNRMMGNVHQNTSRFSQVLTTIACNYPVKVMKEVSKDGKETILFGEDNWNSVAVGPYEGYLMTSYLSEKKVDCFEENYPKFYDGLSLDINDMYYWARLYDQYVEGKSQVKP